MLEIEDEHTYQIFIIMEISEKTLQDEIIGRCMGKKKNYFTEQEIKDFL